MHECVGGRAQLRLRWRHLLKKEGRMIALRWRGVAVVLLLAAGVPALLRSQPRKVTRSFKTWGQYLGGADSSQYSALDQIDKRNVARLEVAWTYSTGDSRSYRFNPLIVDG